MTVAIAIVHVVLRRLLVLRHKGHCRVTQEAYRDIIKILRRFYNISIYCTRATHLMSVSSVGSTASVGFHGQAISLETALDETVRGLQAHLNLVQCHLRGIAATVEQDDDLSVELKLSGDLDDELRCMAWLFDDFRGFATDLISVPDTPAERAMVKKWKIDRKELERKLQAEHTAAAKAEKASNKAALKMASASIAEGDEMDSEKY